MRPDSSVRITAVTRDLLIKAMGKLERQDGIKRTFDKAIRELAEKELGRF